MTVPEGLTLAVATMRLRYSNTTYRRDAAPAHVRHHVQRVKPAMERLQRRGSLSGPDSLGRRSTVDRPLLSEATCALAEPW